MPSRYQIVGAISLVVGGAAVLLQIIITPLLGDLTAAEMLAKVSEHHAAMAWTLALDFPVLLAAPAFLFIGHLAGSRTSALASTAGAFLFFPFVASLPALMGLDGLTFFASAQPDQVAMVNLVDSWQNSAWFAVGLFPYVLLQAVGAILMAVALVRARTVPTWAAVATGLWPILGIVGQLSGVRAISIVGYGVLFATWVVFAMSLSRGRQATPDEPVLATA